MMGFSFWFRLTAVVVLDVSSFLPKSLNLVFKMPTSFGIVSPFLFSFSFYIKKKKEVKEMGWRRSVVLPFLLFYPPQADHTHPLL